MASETPTDAMPLANNVPAVTAAKNVEDDEDFEDETLTERLLGLTEMFPGGLRNFITGTVSLSSAGIQGLYSFSKSGLWVLASSATILVLPLMFELERSQMEEHQMQQQRQILLGPNAAVSGTHPMGAMPALVQQR